MTVSRSIHISANVTTFSFLFNLYFWAEEIKRKLKHLYHQPQNVEIPATEYGKEERVRLNFKNADYFSHVSKVTLTVINYVYGMCPLYNVSKMVLEFFDLSLKNPLS